MPPWSCCFQRSPPWRSSANSRMRWKRIPLQRRSDGDVCCCFLLFFGKVGHNMATWHNFFFKRGGRLDTRNDIFRFLCCMKCLLGNLLVSSMVHFYSQKMLRRNLRCCDSCSTRLGCPSDQVDSQWHKWRHRLVETSRLSADGDHPEYTWSPTSKTCIEPSSPGTIPFVPRRLIFSFVVKQVKMMVCKRNFYFFISFFVEA